LAYRTQRRQAWGDLDDLTLARYLAGEATEAEAGRVRRAMDEHPKVRECVAIVREVAAQTVAADVEPILTQSTTIPLRESARWRPPKRLVLFFGLAVAASLLVVGALTFVIQVRFRKDAFVVLENVPENAVVEIDGSRVTLNPVGGEPIKIAALPGSHAVVVRRAHEVLLAVNLTLESGQQRQIGLSVPGQRPSLAQADDASAIRADSGSVPREKASTTQVPPSALVAAPRPPGRSRAARTSPFTTHAYNPPTYEGGANRARSTSPSTKNESRAWKSPSTRMGFGVGQDREFRLAAEATVKNKLNEACVVHQRLHEAINRQRQIEQLTQHNKDEIRRLTNELLALNQQLAAPDRVPSVQEKNRLVATIAARADRSRQLDAQIPDTRTRRQIDDEVVQRREEFIQAIENLRKLVDETNHKYEHEMALASVERESKARVKLRPSSDFKNSIKQLQNFEKLILTDTIAVARKGGVYEVQVTLNDKLTLPFAYDAGASFVTVSSEVASRLGLQLTAVDPTIHLVVADGTSIAAKRKTIRSVRVGQFTVNDVVCAVLPPSKAKTPPLLGQSFLQHFTVSGSPDSGRLVMSRVSGEEARPNRGGLATETKPTN